jgi:hypothetical protein
LLLCAKATAIRLAEAMKFVPGTAVARKRVICSVGDACSVEDAPAEFAGGGSVSASVWAAAVAAMAKRVSAPNAHDGANFRTTRNFSSLTTPYPTFPSRYLETRNV